MTDSSRPRLSPVPPPSDEPPPESPGPEARGPPSLPHLELGELSPRHRRLRPLLPEGKARLDVALRLLLLLAVSALSATVLGPRLVGGELPGAEDLGKPGRAHVRADRDYALVDVKATSARRLDARRASRSVWDLDVARTQTDLRAVDSSLARLARALEPLRAEAQAAREQGDDEGPPPLPDDAIERLEPVRAKVAGELSLLGLEAPQDGVWGSLVAALWRSPAAADEVVGALRDTLSQPVVGDRGLLSLDEPRGIVVRTVPAELGRGERVIERAFEVKDLPEARAAFEAELEERLPAVALGISAESAARISAFAVGLVRTTLTYNASESEARRQQAADSVLPELVRVRRGDIVLRPGEVMQRRHLIVLEAMERQQGDQMRTRAALGTGAFVLILCFVVYSFGVRGVFRRQLALRDLLFLGAVLLTSLLLLFAADRLVAPVGERWPTVPALALLCAAPTAWAAMQARLCLSADVALLLALLIGLLGGVMAEPGATWTIVAVVSGMAGAAAVGRTETRLQLLAAGLLAGLAGSAAAVALEAFRSALDGSELFWLGASSFAGGLLAGVVLMVTTPAVEGLFGYVTPLKLRALTDLNQPLLKDLIVHAPGTWHHSMRVAHLVVRAAEAIDAEVALARAMALYHDVGKIKDPQGFSENLQGRDNPHDKLEPEESAAILREHVRHGVELARQHRIPREVADVIEEHHGDNRMDLFLQRARRLASRERSLSFEEEEALEARFRYGGPLPRSRESALVMLADQVEAAARGLDEPAERTLREVVDHYIDRALVEDALARCEIALCDLDRVRDAFHAALLELHPPVRREGEPSA